MNKIINKLIKLLKNKKVMILGGFIILLIIIIILLININKISNLESMKIDETSNTIMNYIDIIDDNNTDDESIGKYIYFALIYSKNELNKEELTCDEISSIINNIFNINISSDDIRSTGITPLLLDHNINQNYETDSYSMLNSTCSQSDIASIPITYYLKKSIKKSKNKYEVKYTKYILDNPYELLNYLNDLNNPKPSEDGSETQVLQTYDTTNIYNYLTCKGNIKDVKKDINEDILNNIFKKDKELTITYIIKDNKLLIDKMK